MIFFSFESDPFFIEEFLSTNNFFPNNVLSLIQKFPLSKDVKA